MRKEARIFAAIVVAVFVGIGPPLIVGDNVGAEATGAYPPPESGTWVINNTTYVYNETIIRNGSILILSGGSLILNNVTLKMNPPLFLQYGIEVQSGGTLYINNSVITATNPENRYSFMVCKNTSFYVKNSEIRCVGGNIAGAGPQPEEHLYYGIDIYTENTTIENCIISDNAALSFIGSSGNTIRNSTISNTETRFGLQHYYMHSSAPRSSNNTIFNTTFFSSGCGLGLFRTSYTIISNCTFYSCGLAISLCHASFNTVYNCTISNCRDGINLAGDNNIISHSKICNNEYGAITLYASENTITKCELIGNGEGIYIEDGSTNNNIEGCSILSNEVGIIILSNSPNNVITKCNISSNINMGIETWASPGNLIYHNNFLNNGKNAKDVGESFWDNGYPTGGNYWDDYTGTDNYSGPGQNQSGSDGIGDQPYNISGKIPPNQDRYPLMEPFADINISSEDIWAENTPSGELQLSVKIHNTGWSDYSNVTVSFYDGTTHLGNDTISVPRQCTGIANILWNTAPGEHNITVAVDPESAQRETLKTNNNATTPFVLSNLSFSNFQVTNTRIGLQVLATAQNLGPKDVSGILVEFYFENAFLVRSEISIPKNSIAQTSTLQNIPTGRYNFTAIVDPKNVILETTKKDNTLTITVDVIGTPDLTVTQVYFNPDPPIEGQSATIECVLENHGFKESNETTINFYDNDVLLETKSIPSILIGGQYIASGYWPIAKRGHTIKVEINATEITEYNSSNNLIQKVVLNTLMCDISITSDDIFFDPPIPSINCTTLVYARVNNRGEVPAGITTVRFYENETILNTTIIDTILANSSKFIGVVWKAHQGAVIKVEVVPTTVDIDFTNNIATKSLQEIKSPDLRIESISFNPSNPMENQSIEVWVTISNLGDGYAENVSIHLYDNEKLINITTVSLILPNTNAYTLISWRAQKNHTITAIIASGSAGVNPLYSSYSKTLTEIYTPAKAPQISTQIIVIATGLGILGTLSAVIFTEKGKYLLLTYFPRIAQRIWRREALDNATRSMIHSYIVENSGVYSRTVKKHFNMGKAETRYHIDMLAREKLIAKRKEGKELALYPIRSEKQILPSITMHHKSLLKNLLISIDKGVSLHLLALSSGFCIPTTRKYADDLEKKRIIQSKLRGKQLIYYFTDIKRRILLYLQKRRKTSAKSLASALSIDERVLSEHLDEMKTLEIINRTWVGSEAFYFL